MPLFSLSNLWLLLLVGTSRNVLFFLVNVTKKLTADLIVTSLIFGQFQTSLCVLGIIFSLKVESVSVKLSSDRSMMKRIFYSQPQICFVFLSIHNFDLNLLI